ncbi:MAG: alkaline phosphatase family protein, partial [Janthinobacterium sp.]
MLNHVLRIALFGAGAIGLAACTTPTVTRQDMAATVAADPKLAKIGQIVVVYMENRSFDHLFGTFPGADGIANGHAPDTTTQTGPDGKPYAMLPAVALDKGGLDPRFKADIANAPFRMEPSVSLGDKTASPVHAFWTHKRQINDGKNDRFVV